MADFFNFIGSIWGVLWPLSLQIIGSLFVALAVFEYLYRAYLLEIRKRQLKELKEALNRLIIFRKVIMVKVKDKTRDELEHDALDSKIDNVIVQMNANQRILLMQFDSEFYVINQRFDKFDKLEARIASNEKVTHFLKTIVRYKWAAFLALIGFITTTNWASIKALWIKWFP